MQVISCSCRSLLGSLSWSNFHSTCSTLFKTLWWLSHKRHSNPAKKSQLVTKPLYAWWRALVEWCSSLDHLALCCSYFLCHCDYKRDFSDSVCCVQLISRLVHLSFCLHLKQGGTQVLERGPFLWKLQIHTSPSNLNVVTARKYQEYHRPWFIFGR